MEKFNHFCKISLIKDAVNHLLFTAFIFTKNAGNKNNSICYFGPDFNDLIAFMKIIKYVKRLVDHFKHSYLKFRNEYKEWRENQY